MLSPRAPHLRDASIRTDRLVLGVDTATVVAVGLARGSTVLGAATLADRMAHAEQLTPMIRGVCEQAKVSPSDLDAVVVGLGPGPFTGLRVGVVTARMLAAVLGLELRGVCSLDVLAAEYAAQSPAGEFVVATDARRKEVYWARYAADGTRREGPRVGGPEAVPGLPTVGPGVDLYPEPLTGVPGPRSLDPGVLVLTGPTLPDAGIQPLYLRRPDATEPSQRKPVLARRRMGR